MISRRHRLKNAPEIRIPLGKPVPGLLEKQILEQIKDSLVFRNCVTFRLATQGKLHHRKDGTPFTAESDMRGFPDLIAFHEGQTYWLEVKRPGGSLDKWQLDALQTLAKLRIPCGIVFCADSAYQCINESQPGEIWLPKWLDRPKELA